MFVNFSLNVSSDLYFHLYTVLDIESCDLNIKSNTSSHHTELFGETRLIVRRGQPFNLTLRLKPGSREFKLGETNFVLTAETGKQLSSVDVYIRV